MKVVLSRGEMDRATDLYQKKVGPKANKNYNEYFRQAVRGVECGNMSIQHTAEQLAVPYSLLR